MTALEATIDRANQLECLLRILSLATDGEEIRGKRFNHCGGGAMLDLATAMASEIADALEMAKREAELRRAAT